MSLHSQETDSIQVGRRDIQSIRRRQRGGGYRWAFLGIMYLSIAIGAWAQDANPNQTRSLSAEQIVDKLQQHDQAQLANLDHYQSVRHYAVQYRGFLKSIDAGMEVLFTYDASSGKNFHVISQTGSKMLCEKVLQRALESEKEASQLTKGNTALTRQNYEVRLIGTEVLGGRPAYILDVHPRSPSKFLYEGKVWVDAAEFALAKMEVQPAKNPSFWISKTVIHHSNAKSGAFWLPMQNRSETKVRVGGTAVMTINYGTYQVASRSQPSKSIAQEVR